MSKRSSFSPLDIQIDGDVQATYANIEKVANIADSVDAIGLNIQNVIDVNTDPLKTSILNAGINATNAQTSADNALISEQNAKQSELNASSSETIVIAKEALVSPHYNNIDTVATNITNVNTVATDMAKVNNYADTYQGSGATDPTTRVDGSSLQIGDLFFNETLNEMRVYDGVSWKSSGSTVNGTSKRQTFTATAGQTTFIVNGGYDANFADVFINGMKLVNGVDVDITSGTDFILTVGASSGDVVDFIGYGAFNLANTVDLSSSQTISGVKTFTDSPVIPDAININEPLSKGQLLTEIKAVDGAGSGLDADLVQGVPKDLLGVGGAGYAWVDETANRVTGTTYTNTNGKPILLQVTLGSASSSSTDIYVDGISILQPSVNTTSVRTWCCVIIPSGSTYKVTSGGSIVSWFELK